MAYVSPSIISPNNAGLSEALLNTMKRQIESERSLWDYISDFFRTEISVRNKYSGRLSERVNQIVKGILDTPEFVTQGQNEYTINLPGMPVITVPCERTYNANTLCGQLLEECQTDFVDVSDLHATGEGACKSQIVWWNKDSQQLQVKETNVEAVKFSSSSEEVIRGYRDQTHFYYTSRQLMEHACDIMAYCLENRLTPVESRIWTYNTESNSQDSTCKTIISPSYKGMSINLKKETPGKPNDYSMSFFLFNGTTRDVISMADTVELMEMPGSEVSVSIDGQNVNDVRQSLRDVGVLGNPPKLYRINSYLPSGGDLAQHILMLSVCRSDNVMQCITYSIYDTDVAISGLLQEIKINDITKTHSTAPSADAIRLNATIGTQVFDFEFSRQTKTLLRMFNEYSTVSYVNYENVPEAEAIKNACQPSNVNATPAYNPDNYTFVRVKFTNSNETNYLALSCRDSTAGEGRGAVLTRVIDHFLDKANGSVNPDEMRVMYDASLSDIPILGGLRVTFPGTVAGRHADGQVRADGGGAVAAGSSPET
ncbi:Uncharacterised protein [Escherichia coli]|uniref:hypothetical protein n=1 Tax=Escherichia coli TaxID=562 RepID=UPI000DA4E450|nr:hypothetical protein [Escherichia coli]SQM12232.1 Uncharacterised protein [Escherichia coli]SQM26840.1 Uncharacterised protein [Escherichia coli]